MENLLALSPRRFFVRLTSLFFGLWLAYVGIVKWLGGPAVFVGYITTEFDKTWSPHFLNILLGWLILCAEPICALWLLSGKRLRPAWTAAAALLFLLTFGQTILQNQAVVASNWSFLVLAVACAALSGEVEKSS